MASLPLDFVHTNCGHTIICHVFAPPFHGHLDGIEYSRPRSSKHSGGIRPAKKLRPLGKKPRESGGGGRFALCPWDLFYFHAALSTLNSSHCIHKHDCYSPERHIIKMPRCRLMVIRRPLTTTYRALWLTVFSWLNMHQQTAVIRLPCQFAFVIHKRTVLFDEIENSLNKHPAPWVGGLSS